jgi:hypothetical protein
MVHFVAEKHNISFTMQRGDMLFSNNLALLHARGPYHESRINPQKRHLLRLWLRNEKLGWNTPEDLKRDFFDIYGDSERRAKAYWSISPEDPGAAPSLKQKYTCPT